MFILLGSLSSFTTMAQTSSTRGEHGATYESFTKLTEVIYSDKTNIIQLK